MNLIFKSIFEWIVDQYSLFENPLYNCLAFIFIGAIGFGVAWNFVGSLYRNGNINGKTIGSFIHWTVRLITVTLLYFVIAFIIWIIKLIFLVPWWGWVIFILLLGLIFVFIVLIKVKRKRHCKVKMKT